MRKLLIINILFVVLMSCGNLAYAQAIPNFNDLTSPAVTCYYGTYDNPKANIGIHGNRHRTINSQGYDEHTDYRLPFLPDEDCDTVIKLGNDLVDANAECISYSFIVSHLKSILLLKFAVVFEDPGNDHQIDERPRFMVKVTKPNGELIEACSQYDVYASGSIPGFETGIENEDIRWRPWTSVGIDLSAYIGQKVNVEFYTFDCKKGGHFGYAYYNATCIASRFEFDDCVNPVTIKAPDFFTDYHWNNGDSTQYTTYTLTPEPTDIECTLTSVTGCEFTLQAQLTYDDQLNFSDTLIYDTICIRSEYHDNYVNLPPFDQPGDYNIIKTLMNFYNCDDAVVTLRLHVVDTVPDAIIYDETCIGSKYHNYGFDTITQVTGLNILQKDTLSVFGCDSTAILYLTAYDTYIIDIYDTVCYGGDYDRYNFFFETPDVGDHFDTAYLTTVHHGCDSTVRLSLRVNPIYANAFFDTICFGESYHGHGFGIDSTDLHVGMNYDTLFFQTTLGCDSIDRLELFVAPVYDINLYDTSCFGQVYNRYGFYFEDLEVGIRLDTLFLTSMFGCDSIVNLELCVTPIFDTALVDTICRGYGYHENGFDIENEDLVIGMNYDTLFLHTIHECDSVVSIELFVYPDYHIVIQDSICFGQNYHNYNFDTIQPPVGMCYMQQQLVTALNCDSIINLELYVSPDYDIIMHDTICHGEDYHDYNFDTIQPGLGTCFMKQFLTSTIGCDSVVVMHLFVAPVYDTTFYDTVCSGDGYYEHGFSIDSVGAGMNFDTLFIHTTYNCDSIVYLELFAWPAYDTTFFDTICYGNGYHRHGFEIDSLSLEVGMNYDTLLFETAETCDSIVKLELYVAPVYDTTFIDTICFGNGYHDHGFNIDSLNLEVGMNYDTLLLETICGCDSVVTLELYVAPVYDTTFIDTICFGNGYHEHGFEIDSLDAGMHLDTLFLQTIYGCDSLIYLELYVAPTYDTTFFDTICYGNGYHNHGFEIDSLSLEIGMNLDTLSLQTIYGCDSLIYLELYVAPVFDTNFYDTICFGNGYHEHGFEIDSLDAGMHLDTLLLQTVYGCDSVVTLELYVAPVYDTTFIDTICFGNGYHEHGFEIDSLDVGMYLDTLSFQTIYGCDSVVKLELYVAPVYDTTFIDTICFGNGYHEHGFEINSLSLEVGMNYDTLPLQTIYGCDSLIYLELYVAPVFDIDLIDTICYGEDYHDFNFDTINPAPGVCVMQQQLATATGCDSIVTMNLIVGELYDISIYDSICFGSDYEEYGFHIVLPEVGNHYDTLFLSSIYGCDSTVILELIVSPVFDTTFIDTICFGNGYHEHGFEIDSFSLEVGMNYDTLSLQTIYGCDSLIYLELYVAPVYDISLADSICFGEDYHGYNFDTITPAAGDCVMQQYLTTAIGCDSIVTMRLFVGEVYDTTFNDTICFGEDYDKHNFHLVNPAVGVNCETQHLSSIYSCDSTVSLSLYVAPIYDINVIDSVCEGEDYTRYGLHIEQPAPGFYDLTSELETEIGCDSIFHIDLKVTHTFLTPEEIYGEKDIFVSTDLVTGIYSYMIDSIPGCEEYFWTLNNKNWILTSYGDSCSVIATTPVDATLTVTAGNWCGTVSQTIELHAIYYGVEEDNGIVTNIYPNPCRNFVNIESENILEIKLMTVSGTLVKWEEFGHEDKVTIDLNGIPDALYLIEIKTSEGRCFRRLTVTNN